MRDKKAVLTREKNEKNVFIDRQKSCYDQGKTYISMLDKKAF